MRIGLICPYNYFRPGGVQVTVRELARELKDKGHYVRVIAPRPRRTPSEVDPGVILIGGSAELNTFATKADVGLSISNEKIDAMLAEHNFDVLHFHEPGVPVLSMQLLSRSRVAHVATLHATLPEGMVTKSYQKLMSPIAKHMEPRIHILTAVSEIAKATARVYVPTADIRIVPNGIRLDQYIPKKAVKKSNIKTIVYVGRLEKRKGVKYLIQAYAELRQNFNKLQLIIAGDGDLRPTLEQYVKKNKIPDISFEGFVSENRKIKLMQTADIYCSPAIYGESFGIVLLEAMAAGTIVVAGNNAGYSSVMTGRGRLSLVDPEASSDFAQRLELMLFDEQLQSLWREWSSKYVKQFEYSKVANSYEKAYKDAIKRWRDQQS
ncbi:glycosyltransferase family 4 protein [Candidatus Saccharibacteria bacterium]|nr:glycosyltransferase family 4 protein [Candidatus Saccharibacteria bacterium]